MTNENGSQVRKREMMTTAPVGRLLVRLAIPTVISMLVTSFYNLADTFFVRQLENDSMVAALGVSLTLMTVIQAIGFFFGHGSGNFISRAFGRQEYDEAKTMAACGFFYALGCGVILSVFGLIFIRPLVCALGAKTAATEQYTVEYMRFILCAAPIMTCSLVMNNQLRLQGNAFFAMLGLTSGAVLNLVLDPILIFSRGSVIFGGRFTMPFGFGMGVGGAALATALSQCVGFVILAVGIHRSDNIKIRPENFSFEPHYRRNIVGGGLPSLARQSISSVAVIFLNHAIGLYLTDPVLIDSAQAAMTGVNKITVLISSAVIGFGQGFQPICGFNFGAGKYDRVLKAFRISVIAGTVFLCVAALVIGASAESICRIIIGTSEQTVKIATFALKAQAVTLPLMTPAIMVNMLLQNIGSSVRATAVALARSGLFFLPSVMLLPVLLPALGYSAITGIQLAQPLADIAAFAMVIPVVIPEIRKMRAQIAQ